jgi:4-diphosphocytidyl-2-C-methyl-D-erythritol kinase
MPVFVSPAKINWFLRITSRRDDGYHELQTLFQFLDMADLITIHTRQDGKIKCTIEPKAAVAEQNNLATQAAALLKHATKSRLGAHIHIQKHIHIGGGLGGGSSNAATVLAGLNALWGCHLPSTQLERLAIRLGADVAVFVHGQSVWAEGIGDKFTPKAPPECYHVVIYPGRGVNTSSIFNSPKLRFSKPYSTPDDYQYEPVNDCEQPVKSKAPYIAQTLALVRTYSRQARMTGTGSCIVVPSNSLEEAQFVLDNLPSHVTGRICYGLNHSPLYDNFPDTD